jgi:hypothetical protein
MTDLKAIEDRHRKLRKQEGVAMRKWAEALAKFNVESLTESFRKIAKALREQERREIRRNG